jgi:hypothetical protein
MDTRTYHSIPKTPRTITEAMLHAEHQLSSNHKSKYQWSPILQHAVQAIRYLTLRLKQIRGQNIGDTILQHLAKEGYPNGLPDIFHEADILFHLRLARKHLKELQPRHFDLVGVFLEGLAEAILPDRAPNLQHFSMTAIRKDSCTKVVRNLICRERLRQSFQKIGKTLANDTSKVSHIDVPDTRSTNPPRGNPSDPKSWKGPWVTLTSPRQIAEVVCSMSSKQYNQAHHTHFGSGQLASLIGCQGDTASALDLLNGISLPANVMNRLLPETALILNT